MKDIDFDELDRAVNSLMGSVPKDKSAKAPDEPTVSSDDTTAADIDEPEQLYTPTSEDDSIAHQEDEPFNIPAPELIEDTQPESEQPSSSPKAPRPASRGRFMDVVRPTRDMRKSSFPVSRQGVTLQPSAPKQSFEDVVGPREQATYQSGEADASLVIPGELEDTSGAAAALNDRGVDTTLPTVDDSASRQTEDSAPLDSPFLPDAKVEKRPLGRSIEPEPPVDLEDELAAGDIPAFESFPVIEEQPVASSQEADAQLPEDPLPAELDSNLLSIETDTTVTTAAEEPKQTSLTSNPTIEMSPPPVTENTASNAPAIDVSRAMAAASIPQQYRLESKTSEEVPAGGIYDTQPLAHPAKSKPGWLWVVAILGILVLGAILGAGVYYLGLL